MLDLILLDKIQSCFTVLGLIQASCDRQQIVANFSTSAATQFYLLQILQWTASCLNEPLNQSLVALYLSRIPPPFQQCWNIIQSISLSQVFDRAKQWVLYSIISFTFFNEPLMVFLIFLNTNFTEKMQASAGFEVEGEYADHLNTTMERPYLLCLHISEVFHLH